MWPLDVALTQSSAPFPAPPSIHQSSYSLELCHCLSGPEMFHLLLWRMYIKKMSVEMEKIKIKNKNSRIRRLKKNAADYAWKCLWKLAKLSVLYICNMNFYCKILAPIHHDPHRQREGHIMQKTDSLVIYHDLTEHRKSPFLKIWTWLILNPAL